MRKWGLSDKKHLNILISEGLRERGRLSTKSGNWRARIPQQEIEAGASTQLDNKTTRKLGQEKRADTRAGIRAGIEQNNKRKDDLR